LKLLHKEAHRTDRHARNNAPEVFPLEEEFTSLAGTNLRLSLLVLFAAVLAVLMIACVNVANLLLGHSLRRQRELSIRAALGSGRMRIMRQLLTENLLLSASAAVIGCCFAVAAVDYFHAANPVELPPGKPVEVNLSVLAFTAALSILTTLVFGLFPAWKGSQTDLNAAIKSNARGSSASLHRQRLGHALVVVEVMLSLLLLIAAGLLIRSVLQFGSAPLGFATDGILKLTVTLPPLSYASPAQRINFCDRVLNRLASMPEVREAALTTAIPSIGGSGSGVLSVEGRPEAENAPNDTGNQTVSLDYFRFFQIPLLRGREFAPSDQAHSEAVAVVNSALVREYFPHEDPLGKHLQFRGNTRTDWLLVVGVVADEKHFSHSQEMSWVSSPLIYRPLAQDPPAQLYVMTRGTGQRGVSGDAVRRELAAIDPNVPVFDVETLPHFLLHFTSYPKFRAVLLSAFAGLALLFSVVGLYGVLSQLVEQRTQEIGVRVALGAQQSQVLQLILRDGLRLIGFGLSLGLFASWAFTRFLATLLYGVGTTDSLTFGAVFLLLLAASVLAIYLPARRATRLEPVQALRYE
jgi:putative ABC transport system permease protein